MPWKEGVTSYSWWSIVKLTRCLQEAEKSGAYPHFKVSKKLADNVDSYVAHNPAWEAKKPKKKGE